MIKSTSVNSIKIEEQQTITRISNAQSITFNVLLHAILNEQKNKNEIDQQRTLTLKKENEAYSVFSFYNTQNTFWTRIQSFIRTNNIFYKLKEEPHSKKENIVEYINTFLSIIQQMGLELNKLYDEINIELTNSINKANQMLENIHLYNKEDIKNNDLINVEINELYQLILVHTLKNKDGTFTCFDEKGYTLIDNSSFSAITEENIENGKIGGLKKLLIDLTLIIQHIDLYAYSIGVNIKNVLQNKKIIERPLVFKTKYEDSIDIYQDYNGSAINLKIINEPILEMSTLIEIKNILKESLPLLDVFIDELNFKINNTNNIANYANILYINEKAENQQKE